MGVIGAIVLTRDRPDYFDACSTALAAADPEGRIGTRVMVQNGRDTESEDVAKRDGWLVLHPMRNTSFAEGNNLAEQLMGESVTHLLLLNNDAVVQPGAIEALWEKREHRLLGTVIVKPDGTLSHAGGTFRQADSGAHVPQVLGVGDPPESIRFDNRCYWVTFACALIERALWAELGGLDQRYWYSYEDVDFSLRARERGVRPLVVAGARVVHPEHGTRTGVEDTRNARVFMEGWLASGRISKAMEGGI